MIFDVLHFAGHSWRTRPYDERRALLEELRLWGTGVANAACVFGG
jgi:ATP-dependent DNA ligase